MRIFLRRRQSAFSLIEMAIALAVLGSLTAGVLGVVSLTSERGRYTDAAASLARVERALITFVEENWRLPCPDTTGTETSPGSGGENCLAGDTLGQVPYRTLGLAEPPLDPWQRPMFYAVDRRLTTATLAQSYRYELCQRVRGLSAGTDTAFLHTTTDGAVAGGTHNLAYVLLSGGGSDATESGSRIDQLQAVGSTYRLLIDDFSGPGITGDRYVSSSLFAFAGRLRCPGTLVAANALENEVIAAALTYRNIQLSVDIAQGNIDGVSRQIASASLQIINGVAGVAAAAATAINAAGQGLLGNAAALASFGGAVAGAAAAVASITAAAIQLDEAISSISDMEARKALLATYLNDVERLCSGSILTLDQAKDEVSPCP